MNPFESVFSKLTLTEIGVHIGNLANLYAKPLKVWKRMITNENDDYNLLVLHLIYYSLFAFIIGNEWKTAILYVSIEVILTIIPFLFFIIPFKLFISLFNLRYNWIQLYRLFIILKIQFLTIISILIIVAKTTNDDSTYILIENTFGVLWIAFMVVFPIIIDLKIWEKITWIIVNYSFFVLMMFLWLTINPFGKNIEEKSGLITPNTEYLNFLYLSPYYKTKFSIDDTHYSFMFNKDRKIIRTQFVSHELMLSFLQSRSFPQGRIEIKKDTVKGSKGEMYNLTLTKKKSFYTFRRDSLLTLSRLNIFRDTLNSHFYKLLRLSREMKVKAKFESNRKYFRTMDNYLSAYERSYTDSSEIRKIISHSTLDSIRIAGTIDLGNNLYLSVLNLESNYYNLTKNEFTFLENEIEGRNRKASFLMDLLFYPLYQISNKFKIKYW